MFCDFCGKPTTETDSRCIDGKHRACTQCIREERVEEVLHGKPRKPPRHNRLQEQSEAYTGARQEREAAKIHGGSSRQFSSHVVVRKGDEQTGYTETRLAGIGQRSHFHNPAVIVGQAIRDALDPEKVLATAPRKVTSLADMAPEKRAEMERLYGAPVRIRLVLQSTFNRFPASRCRRCESPMLKGSRIFKVRGALWICESCLTPEEKAEVAQKKP